MREGICVCMMCMLFLVVMAMTGCAELEEMEVRRVECNCEEIGRAMVVTEEDDEGAETMVMETTSDETCVGLVQALHGTWNGLGEMENKRFSMNVDGSYTMWEKRREKWQRLDSGKYTVEYGIHRGLLRPILHLNSEVTDYVVRYHFSGSVLHLEEPSDGEKTMRFERE